MAKRWAKALYKSAAWQDARQYALMRDKYLCQHCGRPAEEVHHIIHLTPDNVTDPSIALNPDNLVSLCRDCHQREHESERNASKYADVLPEIAFDESGNVIAREKNC